MRASTSPRSGFPIAALAANLAVAASASAADTPPPAPPPAAPGGSPTAPPPLPPVAPTPPAARPAAAPAESSAARLLTAADAALDAGNAEAARRLYDQIVLEYPDAPEAAIARRAARALRLSLPAPPLAIERPEAGGHAEPPPASAGFVFRREAYSLRTQERVTLTTWEKLDFSATSFMYGVSVGSSFAVALHPADAAAVIAPIVVASVGYTMWSVLYLEVAQPDRGDLPLVLGITSYLPTTVSLAATAAIRNPSLRDLGVAVALAGTFSVPIALLLAREFDFDPGDAQVVRDAGFWGLILGGGAVIAFAGSWSPFRTFASYTPPDAQVIAGSALIGLYAGMGLGLLAAANSEVSLERVRVTTWGGYGGAILGSLIATAAEGGRLPAPFDGATLGAALGLAVTFALTSGIDSIPPDAATTGGWSPTLMPVASADGQPAWTLGVQFALP